MTNIFRPKQKMLGFLITVYFSPIFCTAQVNDDFSDKNLSINPEWMGNLTHFEINNNLQLQLNADNTGNSYLSTSFAFQEECEWQFWIKLAFSPSSNNNCRVYLMAENSDLSNENLNGYFLQIGESGSNDAIELFRQKGKELYSVCRGTNGLISSSIELRIKIIRSENSLWEIFVDPEGGYLFSKETEGYDDNITFSECFGFFCKYTSGNRKKFYFDDIYIGKPIIDESPPELTSIEAVQKNQLKLEFSEALHPDCINVNENYCVDQNIGNPISVKYENSFRIANLYFSKAFKENTEYTLSLYNIKDFLGNFMTDLGVGFIYYVIRNNDLVINEILFEPLNGCGEYVEVYNRSQKVLNLNKLKFGRIKYDFPNPPDTTLCKISDSSIFIHPEEYWVLSPSPDNVKSFYFTDFPDHFVGVQHMPVLLNDEGHIILVSDSGNLIDEARYHKDMHHPFLSFADGVALEKIYFDLPGLDKNSWQSAAKNVGFGTPAYQNSQFTEPKESTETITINPKVFSPDQNGIDDLLSISLFLKEAGNTVDVYLFNSNGQQVKHLIKNELTKTSDIFYWDGTGENNELLPPGKYIVYVKLFNQNGKTKQIKQAVTLIRQFN